MTAATVVGNYVWRDLIRNPRRSIATLLGITLGVGLFTAVLFFVDGSSASMTHRAIQPLPLDMQRVLTDPLGKGLELTQRVGTSGSLAVGARVHVSLAVTNHGSVLANEVVVRAQPPPHLFYVRGSTTRGAEAVADVGADSPLAQGAAQTGLNVGSIASGSTLSLGYTAQAQDPVRSVATLPAHATLSSREVVVPIRANAARHLLLDRLIRRIVQVPGVATADGLSFVDLADGALRAGGTSAPGPVRVFGFDEAYVRDHSSIRIVRGGFGPGRALLSAEASRAMGVTIGDSINVQIPGRTEPVMLPIGGITDLSRAKALFFSRQGGNLEDFLYVANSVVVSPAFFGRTVIPAYRTAAATRGDLLRSRPIQEVDISVTRARLDADPATALTQTRTVARAVKMVAPGQDYLIDNISNALAVARDDADVAKRMFIFLGVPGALLAAILAAYAGGLLAEAQRREQAILQIRGAGRRHLIQMLVLRTVVLSGVGAGLGLGLGFFSASAVLGTDALGRATTSALVTSAVIGVGGGFLTTGAALYSAGRHSIQREIHDERARISARAPQWQRARLDLIALAVASITTAWALGAHAFEGVPGSVYNGRGVTVRLDLLIIPIAVWIAGSLVGSRIFAGLASRLSVSTTPRFGHLLWGTFVRSLRRRVWAAAGGMLMVTLIVAFGTSVASFTASYDRAKVADARFELGSDLRITPRPTSTITYRPADATRLTTPGITKVTPVVFALQNAVLRSARNEDAVNLAAVVPDAYRRVAPLVDANLVDATASRTMAKLSRDPKGLLVSTELADFLTLRPGDRVEVILARGTKQQVLVTMHVVDLFDRLPAFPEGVGVLANLGEYRKLVPSMKVDFFLAQTSGHDQASVAKAAAAVDRSHGHNGSLHVDSWVTTQTKDQSSLAALNIDGLLTLDFAYALAMATVAITMFVFGLLLQRRREYVTLRAQGMDSRKIRTLIIVEAGTVAGFGIIAGTVVGMAMAYFLVNVLRPLFVLQPSTALPVGSLITFALLVVTATLVGAIAATALVNRLQLPELLRDD